MTELTLTPLWTPSCGRFVRIVVFEALDTLGDRAVPLNFRCCFHEARNAMSNKVSALFSHACRQSRLRAFLSCTPSTPSHAFDPTSTLLSLALARPTSSLHSLARGRPTSAILSLARGRPTSALLSLVLALPSRRFYLLHADDPVLRFVSCTLSTPAPRFHLLHAPVSPMHFVSCTPSTRLGHGIIAQAVMNGSMREMATGDMG